MNAQRHLMLWGTQQTGKTTLINRILAGHPDWTVKGFRSYTDFGAVDGIIGPVYIAPVQACAWYNKKDALVGIRKKGHRSTFPEVFDSIGVRILQDCRDADLLVMDEIGTMENDAWRFQQAVLKAFSDETPIIGVMKARSTPFMDAVRDHSSVKMLEFTPENRGEMLALADQLVSASVGRWQAQRNRPSCGAVVLRPGTTGWETLLIATRNGHWSFPKGHQEDDESEQATAQREILEETGVHVQIDPAFRRELATIEPGSQRKIICFIAHYRSGLPAPQEGEIHKLAWVPLARAPELAARHAQDAQVFRDVLTYLRENV